MAKKKRSDLDIFAPGGFADRLKNQTLASPDLGAFGPGQLADNLSKSLGNQSLALFENEPPKKKRRRTISF